MNVSSNRWMLAATGLILAGAPHSLHAQDQPDEAILPADGTALSFQPYDRDYLMPLHAASVLSWICQDSGVQQALAGSKTQCYQLMAPFAEHCTSELHMQAPAASMLPVPGRLDIVSFREAYRQCLTTEYELDQSRKGRMAYGKEAMLSAIDPLKDRMTRR